MRWNGSVLGRYVSPVNNQGIWDLVTAGLLQKANLWSTQTNVLYNVASSTAIPAQIAAGDLTATASAGYLTFAGSYNFGGAISLSCVAGQAGGQSGIRQDAATFFKAASFSAVGSFGSAANDSQYPIQIDTSESNGSISLDIYNGMSGHTWPAYTTMTANAGLGIITLSGAQAAKSPNSASHALTGGINISSNCSINLATLNATAVSSITANLALYGIVVCIISPSITMTVSGVLSNVSGYTAGITKNGLGTMILTAANTYTGVTTINAGTLQIGNQTNTTANVAGTITMNGGALAYNYNLENYSANGNITLNAQSTIRNLGPRQLNLNGTLNGNGQTLNIYSGNGTLFFSQTVGTSLGQVNILSGVAGSANNSAWSGPAVNVASGAQFLTWSTHTLSNNFTLNGGAGPNGKGAFYVDTGTATYNGTITLASATDSSIGTIGGSITISGQVTGSGSLTKIGNNTLTLSGNNTYTGTTTINAGTLRVAKTSGGITGTASFTNTSLTVDFAGTTPTSGATYQFFPGATSPNTLTVSLTNAGGKTGTYNFTNSTLTIN